MRSTFFITGCFVLVTVASYCVTEAWGQANCNQNCKNVNQTGNGQPTMKEAAKTRRIADAPASSSTFSSMPMAYP